MNEDFFRRRIAELETELESIKAERNSLRAELYGSVSANLETSDEEYLQRIQNHVPGSGLTFLREIESGLGKAT